MACHLISTKLLPELILTFIVRMQQFSFKKMYLQMLAILLNPQCVEDIVVWQMYWFLYCLHRLLYVSSNGVIYGLSLSLNKKSKSWLMLRVQKKDFCEIKCQSLIIVSAMTQDGSVTFTSRNRLLLPLKCTCFFRHSTNYYFVLWSEFITSAMFDWLIAACWCIYFWNSSQNILCIHWRMLLYTALKIFGNWFQSSYEILNDP